MTHKAFRLFFLFGLLLFGVIDIYGQTLLKQMIRGDLQFQLYDNGFQIKDLGLNKILLETNSPSNDLPFGFASYPSSNVDYKDYIFSVLQDGSPAFQWWTTHLISWNSIDSLYIVNASFQNGSNSEVLNFNMEMLSGNKLAIKIQKAVPVSEPWKYRTRLRLILFPDEYFLGFGERLEGVAFRGKKMINWISEGRMEDAPAPNPENQGNYRVPFYLSTRGYGLLLNENSASSFDLGETDINMNEISVWDQQLSFTVYTGNNPLEIIENYTQDAGRLLRTPEPWVFGVWVMVINRNWFLTNTDRSYEVSQKLRNNGIPCSALWHQYWSEKINDILGVGKKWDLDHARWPNYSTLVNDHHANGFNILHYYWPYIFNNDHDYNFGNTNGYFMKNGSGNTYLNQWLSFWAQVAEPDFTRPVVRDWYKDSLMINAFNLGSSGWMTDFGEHHRIDMVTPTNPNPYTVHNEYPLDWAKTNQEFWEQHKPDGDYVFWMRGGWTGIQKQSPLMWIGDPQFDWKEEDGLPSVIPAILSAGISGHPLVGAHVAGYAYTNHYNNYILPSNSEELWIRWLQTVSLTPVLWTHEGDELYFGTHVIFDQSDQTLAMFKKFARLHVAFFPYIYTLVKEGKEKGIPVVRSLYLHYPDDANTISIKDQFLLGDRVLVAPVLDSAATQRTIYFPAGTWYNYWTGSIEATGPATKTVSAPLDHLPVFIKEGTILPLYNREIETLVKNVPGIKDFGYADSTMELRFYGCGTDEFTLWDSTVVQMHRYTGDSAINITGGHQRQYSPEFVNDPSITCTYVIVQTNPQQTLSVFPNPTTGIFNLSFNTQQESVAKIQILNSLGSLILEETIFLAQKSVKKQIDISNFPSGLYLLKVTYGNSIYTIKIIRNQV